MKCLIYVTKGKPYIYWKPEIYGNIKLNGKIVAEFDGEVEEITKSISSVVEEWYSKELLKKSCLTAFELDDYLKGKTGYAIHIKNLVVDGWRDLEEFFTCGRDNVFRYAKRPPQNMMKVWAPAYPSYRYSYPSIKDEYVLISIRPEWACKILNGEKTIEVRRKILKEMKE